MESSPSSTATRCLRKSPPPCAGPIAEGEKQDVIDKLSAIVNCAEEAITIRDLTGACLYVNAAGLASRGSPEGEALGLAGDRPRGEFAPRLEALDAELCGTGRASDAEIDLRLAGHHRHYHVFKHPYVLPTGELAGIITICRDITRRKELESALTAQNDQLRTLDLMKTDFVNTVSHELRTPLSSILGYGEFLEDRIGGELTDVQADFLKHILESTRHLQRLVDDLLDFACCGAGPVRLALQEADLGARLAEVVDSVIPQARKRQQTLTLELPAEPASMMMDPGRITQVALNLIGNAIKFTPEGGTILVRLRAVPEGLITEVIDNGIGIAPRDRSSLFERFYQVDNSTTRESGGAGLGLFISRTIVEAHGGRLDVESQYGEGSRFWFVLPTDPTAAIQARTEEPA